MLLLWLSHWFIHWRLSNVVQAQEGILMRLYQDVERVQVIHIFEPTFYVFWAITATLLAGVLYVAVQHL